MVVELKDLKEMPQPMIFKTPADFRNINYVEQGPGL